MRDITNPAGPELVDAIDQWAARIAATVASRTPPSAPFQPAWAAPITPASGSAKRTGWQSAVSTAMAMPGVAVTTPSA